MYSDQKLSGLIVHRIGDSLDLLLEGLIELTQCLYAILKTAVGHFVRGEALRKERCTGPYQILVVVLAWSLSDELLESLMVKRGEFDKTLLLCDGLAA